MCLFFNDYLYNKSENQKRILDGCISDLGEINEYWRKLILFIIFRRKYNFNRRGHLRGE